MCAVVFSLEMMMTRGLGSHHQLRGGVDVMMGIGGRECYRRLGGDLTRRMMALSSLQRSGMQFGSGENGSALLKYARRKRSSKLEVIGGVKVPEVGTGESEVVKGEHSVVEGGYHRSRGDSDRDKFCVDCNTKKTPLWRAGPAGPKTLCNACGIRYRKLKRKKMNQKMKTKSNSIGSRGNCSSSIRMPSSSKTAEELEVLKQTQKRKQEGLWFLMEQSRKFASKCGKEEAEAAVLLMCLSTNLFVHS